MLARRAPDAADGSEAGEDAEEKIPEAPAEPVTRAGDIWTIAGHKIICCDCRGRDVVHRLFDGARANLNRSAGQSTCFFNRLTLFFL